ncbi:MAG: NAD-dependent epimerase/dehydratase family protein [Solirubrobacterales bacterium]|nr:NAD-dependent epimerase/dehydratase family protein [Solirubrobacterales bacterium]
MSITLITGGAGFIGTNTADRLLSGGTTVRILDDLSRPGVERNLHWLEREHGSAVQIQIGDVRERDTVSRAMHGVTDIFHFAAQVAVTTSLAEPVHDASVNVQGTINVLDEARIRTRPPSVAFTSTNKVYGSLPELELVEREHRYEPADARLRASGIGETRPLRFCTPYGCSKGAADQYVLDWATSYGVPTVVFRMSCIYGPHQFGTEDQGWVAHFLISAINGDPITIYGDGKQVRDVLFVEELVDALVTAQWRCRELAGRAFNIGGGARNAISLLELLDMIMALRGEQPVVHQRPWRQGDQRYYVSDNSAFTRATGWRPGVAPRRGVGLLHRWLVEQRVATEAVA